MPHFTIGDDYDPGPDLIGPKTDPMSAYLTYLDKKNAGVIREMHFSLLDFERHIASLRERRPLG